MTKKCDEIKLVICFPCRFDVAKFIANNFTAKINLFLKYLSYMSLLLKFLEAKLLSLYFYRVQNRRLLTNSNLATLRRRIRGRSHKHKILLRCPAYKNASNATSSLVGRIFTLRLMSRIPLLFLARVQSMCTTPSCLLSTQSVSHLLISDLFYL